jgi:hypothetical protein
MGTSVVFNGVSYTVPALGESGWGTTISNYLIAIASGSLQKTGGAFTLTADADFGSSKGLKSIYTVSRSSNIAQSGFVRLANNAPTTDAIVWREAANSQDYALYVDSNNNLKFGNFVISPAGGGALTTNRALITNGSTGAPTTSATTSTEIGFVSGVTSAIQTQLNTGATNLTTHAALTSTHGVSGAIVGTTDTQTLLNKTVVSSTAAITGALTLPSGTAAQRPTPTAGMTRLNTDSNSFEGYANGIWSSIGGGLNEQPVKNYLKTYAEANVAPGTLSTVAVGGNITIASGTSAFYADTTSGSAALTTSASTLLRGSNNYLSAASGASLTGSTFFQLPAMTLETADAGKPQSIIFDTTGNTTDGDWDVVVANYTSAGVFVGLIPVAGNASACSSTASAKLPTGTAQFNGFFIPTSTAGDTFALRFRRLAGSVQVRIDSLFVGNIPVRVGAAVTDPLSITFAVPTGLGAGSATNTATFSRSGKHMFVNLRCLKDATPGSGATAVVFTMPTGYTINLTDLPASNHIGVGALDTTTAFGVENAAVAATSTTFVLRKNGTAANYTGADLTANSELNFQLKIPISEWSSNVQMADRALEEYASNSSTSVGDDTTSFAYGSDGSQFRTYVQASPLTAGFATKRVRFQSPIQLTDTLVLEVFENSIWSPIYDNTRLVELSRNIGTTNNIGMSLQSVSGSSTDVNVVFGLAGRGVDSSGSALSFSGITANTAYKWRVRKVSSGAQIGGAISTSNIVGRTDGSTVGSGYIGETIEAVASGNYLTTTSAVNVPGLSLTLTKGLWQITYAIGVEVDSGATAGNNSQIVVDMADATPTSLSKSKKIAYCKTVAALSNIIITTISASFTLNATTVQTYTIRARRVDGAGTGIAYVIQDSNSDSTVIATRIA